MVRHRVGLGQLVALALSRDHMQELRTLQMLDVLQCRHQRLQVVPVDRADVIEAKLLEQCRRHHQSLGAFLKTLGQFEQRRRDLEHVLANAFRSRIKLAAHELREIPVQRADRRADRHVVVVQDHQQVALGDAGVVQCLEGHAGTHGAIADDRHRLAVLALVTGRYRHAERGGNAC